MFSLGGACTSSNAGGSSRSDNDVKGESKATRRPMITAR